MLDVQQVRLRFIFVRALYPVPLFSKANGKWYFRTDRMSEVLISSDVFAAQKLASGSVHGCTLPDRMSVVISSRSFCSIRPPSVTDMKKRPDVVAQLQ